MKKIKTILLLVTVLATAEGYAEKMVPAASTVNAHYVEPSAKKMIMINDKISDLFNKNIEQPYILQKIGERTYFVQRYFYATIFYVGDNGVLLFDAPEGRGEYLLRAIREVTPLPVTALIYSHYHVDHMGDSHFWVAQAQKAGVALRIIAGKATVDKMHDMYSQLPKANEILSKNDDWFNFEKLIVEYHRFRKPAHTDDHSVWLLKEQKVAYSPDLLNPDQLPVMGFSASDTLVYHDENLRQVEALDWDYFIGGHGNIGSREDFQFQRRFFNDLREATSSVRKEEPFWKYINKSTTNHADFVRAQRDVIIKRVMEILRPEYGHMYGYDASMPANIELAIRLVGSY